MMNRSVLLAVLVTASTAAFAQLNADIRGNVARRGAAWQPDPTSFLKILDANGRKVLGGGGGDKKDLIAIQSFSQASHVERNETTGTLGAVKHGELTLVKSADAASAILLELLDEGSKLQRVELMVYDRDPSGEESEAMKIRLDGARILSIETRLVTSNPRLPASDQIREEIVFAYDRIAWSYADGTSSYTSRTSP